MVKKHSLYQTLHDVLVEMAAQAVMLLSPAGQVLEKDGGIDAIDEQAVAILMAQSVSAFQHLVAKGQNRQMFFAYQDANYHFVGTGKPKKPFLVAVFQSQLHRPPALGASKFSVKRAYQRIGLGEEETNSVGGQDLPLAGLFNGLTHQPMPSTSQAYEDLHVALEETARELQCRLLLAIEESGNVVDVVGTSDWLDIAEIGALTATSLAAFTEIGEAMPKGTHDPQSLAILEGPRGTLLLARGNGPLTFLAILPPGGFVGMARLMLKDLLQREWKAVETAWQELDTPPDIDELPLTELWSKH